MESNEVKNEGYNNENTEIISIPTDVSSSDITMNVENNPSVEDINVNISENNSEMELPKKEENIITDSAISNEMNEPLSVPVDPIKAASEHINNSAAQISENDLFKPIGEPGSINQPMSSNAPVSNNNDFMIKKDKKVWPIVLIVVLLLVVGLGCTYYFVIMSPKNIFTKTIDSLFTEVDNGLKSYKDVYTSKDSSVGEGNVLVTATEPKINLSIDYYIAENIKDKKAYLEANVKSDNKDVISATIYNEKDMLYILSKDIYSKAIGIKLEEGDLASIYESSDIDIDDIRYIVTLVKDTIKNNINYEKVTKTLKTDSGLYFETIYNFDKAEQKSLSEAIRKALTENEKMPGILSKISGKEITKDDLKDIFSSSTKDEDRIDTKIILHTDVINGKVTYFEFSNEEGKATFEISGEEVNILVKDVVENKDMLSVKIDNNSVSGTVYGDNSDLSGNVSTAKVVFSIKNNKISDKKYEISSSFSVYKDDDTEPLGTMTFTSKIDSEAKPKEFDKTGVVMSDKLTEEDMVEIQMNLFSLLEKIGIELPTFDDSDLIA